MSTIYQHAVREHKHEV